ncbi:galectin-9B-like [Petromyzon marinus]|uniref:galectin-9B-like n=1 Tax=Petromyzon marinus TaxID=7757 RepID=UPI003F70378B
MAFYAPAQSDIVNPAIPYVGMIFGGLSDGKMVMIKGMVPHHSGRFQIDFQCGSSVTPRADVAFHFNPRWDEGPQQVVCNTLQRQAWGKEQRAYNTIMRGQAFEIIFMVSNHSFKVAVNGSHFMEYPHRIHFASVDTLSISGAVNVYSISFTQNQMIPQPFPSTYPSTQMMPPQFMPAQPPPYPGGLMTLAVNPAVPYSCDIPGGLYTGRIIIMNGVVSPKAHRFTVNLQIKGGQVVLHLNPRFDEHAFVRNSLLNKSWGSEERQVPFFPFNRGQGFQMNIQCDATDYKVSINGQHLFSYNHRVSPVGRAVKLEVTGDVTLTNVQLQ